MTENNSYSTDREVLKFGLSLGALAVTGCGSEEKPKATPEIKSDEIPQEILDFYPELLKTKATSFDSIETSSKTVNIANFTDIRIDTSKLQDVYNHLERLASDKKVGSYSKSGSNEVILYQLQPNQRRTQNIFVVPQDAQLPSWGNFEAPAVTIRPFEASKPYLTRISLIDPNPNNPYLNTHEKIINAFISTEACQATVEVLGQTPMNADLMQEVYCNSIGSALAIKQQGKSYADYLDFQQNSVIVTPIGEINYLKFNSEEYARLPQ